MWLTDLCAKEVGYKDGRIIWELVMSLKWRRSDGSIVEAPTGFQTDFCSVPRHPAAIYGMFGAVLNRQGVIHDLAYRKDAGFTFEEANGLFHEVCQDRYPDEANDFEVDIMYGVLKRCGKSSYHQKCIADRLA